MGTGLVFIPEGPSWERMGRLREYLGVGKPVMGYGLGVFHLFLGGSFLYHAGGELLQLGTALVLFVVGTGMILWGYSHH